MSESEVKLGDLVDAPNHAPDGYRLIGIWEEKAWLMYPDGGTTVAPIDGIVLHRDKIKPVVEAKCPEKVDMGRCRVMKKHMERYHL